MQRTLIAPILLASLAACSNGSLPADPQATTDSAVQAPGLPGAAQPDQPAGAGVNRGVAAVRHATARYHDIAAAQEAGYVEQWPEGCAASPEGAQAYHYRDASLVDGMVDLLRPELLMYEPQPDGSLQLIGVDYFVPFDAWTGAEPPRLLGQEFMANQALGAWTLHIWGWRPNPSGMFAPWNPNVSCEHAAD